MTSYLMLLAVCIIISEDTFNNTTTAAVTQNVAGRKWLDTYPEMKSYHQSVGSSRDMSETVYVKDCPPTCKCSLRYQNTQLRVSECKTNPIDALPKLFNSNFNISSLQIYNCSLSRLPQMITKMHRLETIDMAFNSFTIMPPEVLHMSNLTHVGFRANTIQKVPSQISQLPKLKLLDLGINKFELFPVEITRVKSLQYTLLDGNIISRLPPELGNMNQSLELILSHNQIQSLPREISSLVNMGIVNLCFNQLREFPEELWTLPKLRWLLVRHNHIEVLPAEVSRLQLNVLNLGENRIKRLPNEIINMTQLQQLYVNRNDLKELPPKLPQSLQLLSLGFNRIQPFPCQVLHLSNLRDLDLGHNAIKSVVCMHRLPNSLYRMSLSYNALYELPCDYAMQALRIVDFSHNNISDVPDICGFFGLTILQSLDLSWNGLHALPLWQFCTRTNRFKNFNFSHNKIRAIVIGESRLYDCFVTATNIDLSENRLQKLDSWPLVISKGRTMTLDASGNLLSKFTSSAGSFLPLSKYGSIFRMQRNQIKHFMDVFNGWQIIVNTTEKLNTLLKNAYFDLGGNPLVCDCVDYEVYKYIQTLQRGQYQSLVCQEPLSLRGQNPHNVSLERFVCDLNVHCPKGCSCTNVPHLKLVNITCHNYSLTGIPKGVPELPAENYGYHLDFCNQNLSVVTFRPYLWEAVEVIMTNSSIEMIEINSSKAFQNFKRLHLDSNYLQRLPVSVIGMNNGTATDLRLGNNPWVCDCEAMTMKNWIMLNMHMVKDEDLILCHSPPSMAGIKVKDIERSLVCPNENKTAVYVVAAISSAVFIFMVYKGIADRLKYANWRLVGSDECDGEGKVFDVFMCSADADSAYIENYLIPELERRDFRVCYHREHFHGGKPIHVNMSEAIAKSKRTLAFFSNNFKASPYSMFEFHSAYDLDIQNGTRRLITIKDTDLDMDNLDISEQHYFQTHTYIQRENPNFWGNLEHTLPRMRLGAQVRLPGL